MWFSGNVHQICTDCLQPNPNMDDTIKFMEWVLELMPPEYDMDTRRRFTPQVPTKDGLFLWIETHKHSSNPIFYSTSELYNLYLTRD
jgi:hypothetical protein